MRIEYKRRLNGKKYALSEERMNVLDSLGFVWVIGKGFGPKNDLHWNKRMNELREFHEMYGHCRVPLVWPDNPPLGKWIQNVRRTYGDNCKRSSLTAHRVAELNNLGFEWVLGRGVASNAFATWNLQVEELREFIKEHGHCTIPQTYPQNPSFGKWVSRIRCEFKRWRNGKDSWLTEEHIAELHNLGFNWVVPKKRKKFGNAHVDQQQQQNGEKEVGLATVPRRGSEQGGGDNLISESQWDLFGNAHVDQQQQQNGEKEASLATVPRRGSEQGGVDEKSVGKLVSKIQCEFRIQQNGQESSLTAECIATLNNLGFDWRAVGKKARDFHLHSRDDQQQQHHGQKEAALATVPRYDSKEEEGLDNEAYWI